MNFAIWDICVIVNNKFGRSSGDSSIIFTRDWITHEKHLRVTPLVTKIFVIRDNPCIIQYFLKPFILLCFIPVFSSCNNRRTLVFSHVLSENTMCCWLLRSQKYLVYKLFTSRYDFSFIFVFLSPRVATGFNNVAMHAISGHINYSCSIFAESWWRHEMENPFALLALCAGNSSVTDDIGQWWGALIFSLRLNKRLSKTLSAHNMIYVLSNGMLSSISFFKFNLSKSYWKICWSVFSGAASHCAKSGCIVHVLH